MPLPPCVLSQCRLNTDRAHSYQLRYTQITLGINSLAWIVTR
ncbi:hypothetical protein VP468E531_P0064 [Vibrio phage 468E53-1]|nr:hypothetical protein VP468E531_P0064 [Vibrio phage 468E53-1]CAH9016139.1 hypothetical protein VP177E371_P0063 [Vibrio phage 177E37-1]